MIRPAQVSDLAQVLSITKASAPWIDFTPGWLVKQLATPGMTLQVEDAGGGIVRGYMMTAQKEQGLFVELIATSPFHRGKGVGKALLAGVFAPAFTYIAQENTASRGLFESCGWRLTEPPRKKSDYVYYHLPVATP